MKTVDLNNDGIVDKSDLALIKQKHGFTGDVDAFVRDYQAWQDSVGTITRPMLEGFEDLEAFIAKWPGLYAGGVAVYTTSRRVYSGERSLCSSGASWSAFRKDRSGLRAENVQISANIYLNTLIPAYLYVRGKFDEGDICYKVVATRGLGVTLLRVTGDEMQNLGSIYSQGYFSSQWAKVTLWANGDNLRVRVFDLKKSRFLDDKGAWVSSPTFCINVIDDVIQGAGTVGFGRDPKYAGKLYFDDVIIEGVGGDTSRPVVEIVTPTESELTGIVEVVAKATDPQGIRQVQFKVDGVTRSQRSTKPYQWHFDTSTVANGEHLLEVVAIDQNDNQSTASQAISTTNDNSVYHPAIPQRMKHIRVAMLMYGSYGAENLDDFEKDLLRNYIDLVVANSSYVEWMHEAAPDLPILEYTNFSNIYLGLLKAWNQFADKYGYSREAAFYHVSKPTRYYQDGDSTVPVDRFWKVEADGVDVTSNAYYDTGEKIVFNRSLKISYPEKFDTIRFVLQRAATDEVYIEYQQSKFIWLTADTTKDFSESGEVYFDPPQDWQPDADGMYSVCLGVNGGGNGPVISQILAVDYTNSGGETGGTIPAFDYQADVDGDGYLNGQEWATRRPGFNATLAYQGRLFSSYGSMRFTINPTSAIRNFLMQRNVDALERKELISGFFVDNSSGWDNSLDNEHIVESTDSHLQDYAAMTQAVARAIEPKFLLLNALNDPRGDHVISKVPVYMNEFLIRPFAHNLNDFKHVASRLEARKKLTSPSPLAVLDSHPQGGMIDPVMQISTLAYYYLLADPERTMFMPFGGYAPSGDWEKHWFDAIKFDVGMPMDETWSSIKAMGVSVVLQRRYENALVLWRPYDKDSTDSEILAFDRKFAPIAADGSEESATSTIALGPGEGAILKRVDPLSEGVSR